MYEDQKNNYTQEEKKAGLYHRFSSYFVDDKENLKDIMQ